MVTRESNLDLETKALPSQEAEDGGDETKAGEAEGAQGYGLNQVTKGVDPDANLRVPRGRFRSRYRRETGRWTTRFAHTI